MSLAEISQQLTHTLTAQLNYNEDKKEIIAYAIETSLLTISGTVLIAIVAYVLNAFVPTLVAAAFGGLLRRLSGGAHFNTPLKCQVSSTFTYSLIGVLALWLLNHNLINPYVNLILLVIALVIISILAPVDSEAKPIHSKSLRRKLKTASIVFVLLVSLMTYLNTNSLVNISAVLGVLSQSITLLPMFNKKGGDLGL